MKAAARQKTMKIKDKKEVVTFVRIKGEIKISNAWVAK